MSDSLISGAVAVLMAILGIAILAVIVSKNSNTSGVLTAGGSAFSGILKTALSPVSGSGSGGLLDNAFQGVLMGG